MTVAPGHVILDRDGVLNFEAAGGWVLRVEDWRWLPGALEGLRRLSAQGFRLSIATNQSCIGRGLVSAKAVAAVHRHMEREAAAAGVEFDGVYVCPHAPEAGCPCRKPRPGLLLQAMTGDASAGLSGATAFVGDSATDLQAARAAGVQPVLVRSGKGALTEGLPDAAGVPAFDDLLALAHFLGRDGAISALSKGQTATGRAPGPDNTP